MGITCSNCTRLSTGITQGSEDVSKEQTLKIQAEVLPEPRIWQMPNKQNKLKPPIRNQIGLEDEFEFEFMECEFSFYLRTAAFYKQQFSNNPNKLKLDQNYLVDCEEEQGISNSNIESDTQKKIVTQNLKGSLDGQTINHDNSSKLLKRLKSGENSNQRIDKDIQSMKAAANQSAESLTPRKSILKESKQKRESSLHQVYNENMTNKSINTSKSKKKVKFDQASIKNSRRNFNYI